MGLKNRLPLGWRCRSALDKYIMIRCQIRSDIHCDNHAKNWLAIRQIAIVADYLGSVYLEFPSESGLAEFRNKYPKYIMEVFTDA